MEKKSDNAIHQPHDKLVKRLLSDPKTAQDILSLYLPKEILEIADLNTLEMQKDSFIDDEHRAYAVDILYKTKFKNEDGYIWVLLEHQRKSDVWMPVRIFKYIAMIWDHLRKAGQANSVPLIYPLIVYNGDRPYDHSLTLSDLIVPDQAKEIFRTLFIKPFEIIDLAAIQDEALRYHAQDHVKGVALLMTLKHVFDRNLQAYFDQILIKILKKLDEAGDTDEVVDVLYYLLKESEFLDEEQFLSGLHRNFSSKVEGKIMTIAQQLEERGKLEVAKRLLEERQAELNETDLIQWVFRMTGLPIEKIKGLRKKH